MSYTFQRARSQKPTLNTLSVKGRPFFKVLVDLAQIELSKLTDLVSYVGLPGPDFPSGLGESQHLGRLTPDFVMQNIDIEAQRAMGLTRYHSDQRGLLERERQTLKLANEILGFEL